MRKLIIEKTEEGYWLSIDDDEGTDAKFTFNSLINNDKCIHVTKLAVDEINLDGVKL